MQVPPVDNFFGGYRQFFLNSYIIKTSEDKYRYFKCNFNEKNNYTHIFEEKTSPVIL